MRPAYLASGFSSLRPLRRGTFAGGIEGTRVSVDVRRPVPSLSHIVVVVSGTVGGLVPVDSPKGLLVLGVLSRLSYPPVFLLTYLPPFL